MAYGEFDYRKLLSEKEFLLVLARSRALPSGSLIRDISYRSREVVWKTESATTPGKIWTQTVLIKDLSKITTDITPMKIQELIRASALEIYCDCPAFLYWGYKYKAWTRGYGLEKEVRFPKVRNPHLQGFVCKHLYSVLTTFPFLVPKIQSAMYKELKADREAAEREVAKKLGLL
jgi:hypothetical protein